jgi:hypothetical protein
MSEQEDRYEFPQAQPVIDDPVRPLPLVLVAALVAGVVGGVVWGLIVKWSNYEVGIVAWAIGFLAGTAVVTVAGRARGAHLQGAAVAGALVGVLLGKYLSFAFSVQEDARSIGLDIGVLSSEMRSFFRENLREVFGLFDLLWIGLAVFTAWRIPGEEPAPAASPPPAG